MLICFWSSGSCDVAWIAVLKLTVPPWWEEECVSGRGAKERWLMGKGGGGCQRKESDFVSVGGHFTPWILGLKTHSLMLTLTHKRTHTHTSTVMCRHTCTMQLLVRITAQPRTTSLLFYNTQADLRLSPPFSYPSLLLLQYGTFLCSSGPCLLPPLSRNPAESFGPSHPSPHVHTFHQRCPGEIKIPPFRQIYREQVS